MKTDNPRIPLPKSWSTHVRAAMLHVIALAQFATAYKRSWSANSMNSRIRLTAQRDRAVHAKAIRPALVAVWEVPSTPAACSPRSETPSSAEPLLSFCLPPSARVAATASASGSLPTHLLTILPREIPIATIASDLEAALLARSVQ
jgi:hypothetical protein